MPTELPPIFSELRNGSRIVLQIDIDEHTFTAEIEDQPETRVDLIEYGLSVQFVPDRRILPQLVRYQVPPLFLEHTQGEFQLELTEALNDRGFGLILGNRSLADGQIEQQRLRTEGHAFVSIEEHVNAVRRARTFIFTARPQRS